jgi:hypothetical protein
VLERRFGAWFFREHFPEAVASSGGIGIKPVSRINNPSTKGENMSTITTKDGTQIYFQDWGKGPPIVFSRGWPLSADDWDAQMLFFLKHGYRVIAHD